MEDGETGAHEQRDAHVQEPPQAPQEAREGKGRKKKKSKKEIDRAAVAAAEGYEGPPAPGEEGGASAAAPEEGPPTGVRPKRKRKRKEGGLVIVDNPEDRAHRSETSKADTVRKSTLLLCDSAAAVALGNLVAIQRKLTSGGEADEAAEAAKLFEEFEEENSDDVAEKAAAAEERVTALKEAFLTCTFEGSAERFLNELQEITKEEHILVGEALEEDVLALEHKEAQENMSASSARQEEQQAQQQCLLLYEQVLRKRILEELEKKEAQLAIQKGQAEKQDRERQDHLVKLLRECECRMEAKMKRRRARLSSVYGLLRRDGEFMADATNTEEAPQNGIPENLDFVPLGKSYRIEWEKAPQLMRMRVDLCRGVKDKLPPGRIVLLVSMWTRLGGKRLRWSGFPTIEESLKSAMEPVDDAGVSDSFLDLSQPLQVEGKPQAPPAWGAASAATKVVHHRGQFTDEMLRFDEDLELACPSVSDVEPGMCFVFELFLLRGHETPVDEVVGWGVFPMVDSDFRLIDGHFKVPLLRGSVDPNVRRFIEVEETVRKSLDSWLCNLYFRCQPLPQYSKGQVEFELQLEHAGFLLGGQKQQQNQAQPHHHKQSTSRSAEREKADTLIQQLVSALEACEDMQTGGEAIASKDGVRAWRHKEPQVEPFSEADVNDLGDYGYSVYCGTTLSHPREASRKLRYLKAALLDEFRLSVDEGELCALISGLVCILLALWACSSLFALGCWFTLRVFGFPVYNIQASFLYIQLQFVQELTSLKQILITTVAGPLTCFLTFVLCSLILYLANLTLGRLPLPVYQFFSAVGACTTLSPILITIIEGIRGQTDGLAFLLFNYYLRESNNGTLGILMTLIIDIVFLTVGCMAYYKYALYVHLHGQVMDIHRRLTGDNSLFILPRDFEVSSRYLHWCCMSAHEYRGPQGQLRSVTTTRYPLTQAEENTDLSLEKAHRVSAAEGKKQSKEDEVVVTDLQIFNVEPAVGKQTLYRRFLIYPDGTITEVVASAEKEEEKAGKKSAEEKERTAWSRCTL